MNKEWTILGGGAIGPDGSGQLLHGAMDPSNADPDRLIRQPDLFPVRPKNCARFDRPSRLTCCAVALALRDADLPATADATRPLGIVGWRPYGAHCANRAYFDDYLAAGRTLGRGNLFIYTLPTSPLAEAAIHFKLAGPCFHVAAASDSDPIRLLVETGARLIRENQCPQLLLVASQNDAAAALAIGATHSASPGPAPADQAVAFLKHRLANSIPPAGS